MSLVTAESFRGFDLKFDELNSRLQSVKKEFGMRRAISTRSLTGETRTFAEILDQQVETIVLYYLEVQGILAKQTRLLRSRQVHALQDYHVSLDTIELQCQKYREIAMEMVELLSYLERNSVALRRILRRHDALFDQKMGSMYFDTRLIENTKNSQLRQLYHQEGLRAIMDSVRRGFEELYDARRALLDGTDNDLSFTPFTSNGPDEGWSLKFLRIPKISFRKRLQSFSNLQGLASQLPAQQRADLEMANLWSTGSRNKSSSSLHQLRAQEAMNGGQREGRNRSVSELEPVLARAATIANRLMKTQSSTTLEFLSSHSSIGLELKMRDMQREEEEEEEDRASAGMAAGKGKPAVRIVTDHTGLLLNHFLTFLYLANQYIVAPSSAEYAMKLGMSSSMSGIIIGLTPAAALVSSWLYSMWSNHSFTQPLLFSIACGILGNLLYGMALQCDSAVLVLVGRLLTGFGGPRVVSRRYIADHVALEDRLLASSQFVTAGALGLACGPLFASLVEVLDWRYTWQLGGWVLLRYEKVTASGWLMGLLWVCAFVGVACFFQEPTIRKKMKRTEEEAPLLSSSSSSSSKNYRSAKEDPYAGETILYVESCNETWQIGEPDFSRDSGASSRMFPSQMESEAWRPRSGSEEIARRKSALPLSGLPPRDAGLAPARPTSSQPREVYSFQSTGLPELRHLLHENGKDAKRQVPFWEHITWEVHAILFLYVVHKAGQELTVSSMPTLLRQVFGWNAQSVGYSMAMIGSLVLPTNIFVNLVAKDVEERDLVIRLTLLALVGVAVVMHWTFFSSYSFFRYILGAALIFTSLNALEGVIMSLLARLLSPELAQGTFNSGFLATEAGTFGRVLGDIAITLLAGSMGEASLVNRLFSPLAAMLLGSAIVVYRNYDRFID